MYGRKALLLCGGKSARMGVPKHTLRRPDDRPLYLHLAELLIQTSKVDGIYLSLHNMEQQKSLDHEKIIKLGVQIILDDSLGYVDIGPAAGLLAAYSIDKDCTWLVIACDYPLINADEIRHLLESHGNEPITCLFGALGYAEPLLALWDPSALLQLQLNVRSGITGPKEVISMVGAKTIQPRDERSLINANTPQEWSLALQIIRQLEYVAQPGGRAMECRY